MLHQKIIYFHNAEETSCSALALVYLEPCQTSKMSILQKYLTVEFWGQNAIHNFFIIHGITTISQSINMEQEAYIEQSQRDRKENVSSIFLLKVKEEIPSNIKWFFSWYSCQVQWSAEYRRNEMLKFFVILSTLSNFDQDPGLCFYKIFVVKKVFKNFKQNFFFIFVCGTEIIF